VRVADAVHEAPERVRRCLVGRLGGLGRGAELGRLRLKLGQTRRLASVGAPLGQTIDKPVLDVVQREGVLEGGELALEAAEVGLAGARGGVLGGGADAGKALVGRVEGSEGADR